MQRSFKVLVVLAALLAVVFGHGAARAQDRHRQKSRAEVTHEWLSEFAKLGVAPEQVEEALGHPLGDATRADTDVLLNLLDRARRGEFVAKRKAAESPRPADSQALSPAAAAKLSEQVDQSFATLRQQLKKAEELIAKMPTRFPPDLKAEELTIDQFLEVVRTCKQWAADFERQSPEMLEAATKYRAKLKEAIATLAKGADEDRADGDVLLAGLASTQDLVGQAYTKRLEWAESLYTDLQGQLATVKRSQKLLSRWEAVLLLMKPIAKEGSVTQENLRRLLEYHQALEEAMKQFRSFGEKMRAGSEAGAAAPSKATNGASPSPVPPKPADKR